MAAERVSQLFDIPGLYYFQSKNIYTGSKNKTFNFKIIPGDTLKVQLWHGMLCSEKSEIETEQEFPLDHDGYIAMIKWLEEVFLSEKK